MEFIVEGKIINGHEIFERNARQIVSGSLHVLARECNGCNRMLLADKFRTRYSHPTGKCKDCQDKVQIENEARKKAEQSKVNGDSSND